MFLRSVPLFVLLVGMCIGLPLAGCGGGSDGSTPSSPAARDVTETFTNSTNNSVHLYNFQTNQGASYNADFTLSPGQSSSFIFKNLNSGECVTFNSAELDGSQQQSSSFCNSGSQTYVITSSRSARSTEASSWQSADTLLASSNSAPTGVFELHRIP